MKKQNRHLLLKIAFLNKLIKRAMPPIIIMIFQHFLNPYLQVPVNALEQLLPDGTIKMSKFDKGLVTAAGAVALTGILAKVVTLLAHMHVDWTLLVTGVMGLAGVQAWTTYKNRHLRYVNDLARMLYFKNIANNRGLLALLVDRAEDELFKVRQDLENRTKKNQ